MHLFASTKIDELVRILRQTGGRPLLPSIVDRAAWAALVRRPIAREITAEARASLAEPTPPLRATDYLAYFRTGSRQPFANALNLRNRRLMLMSLAECLEDRGRFLDAILDEAWAICESALWVNPAHSESQLPDPGDTFIDLSAAMTASGLAEIDYLLGDRLHPGLRQRIRHEVHRRIIAPYLDRDDFRWMGGSDWGGPINNWLAVCTGCIGAAALYLEDSAEFELDAVLNKTLIQMARYLGAFGEDAVSAEGVSYWEYGFFHFTAFADLLHRRTDGRIDLLADPYVQRVARSPLRLLLSPGHFVPFSDIVLDWRPKGALLNRLAERCEAPELRTLLPYSISEITKDRPWPLSTSRALFWHHVPGTDQSDSVGQILPGPSPARLFSDFMASNQWLVARARPDDPAGLVVAAKGGHNNEPHNHNDVGNFVIHWRGETLVAELGAGEYTSDYFREGRYAIINNRSRGHNVPLVNGFEQCPGAEYRAAHVQHRRAGDEEMLEMEIAPAYPPEAGLASLRRRLLFQRSPAPARLTVTDTVRFLENPGRFESALLTFADVKIEEKQVTLTGQTGALRITYDAEQLAARTESIVYNDFSLRRRQATRIAFVLRQPASEAVVVMNFHPL